MLPASQAFADAVDAAVSTPIARVVVDFGDGAGPVDVTGDVEKVELDRSLTTNIPDQAHLTAGYASAAATVTLGPGTTAEPASHAYSPYVRAYTLGGAVEIHVGYDTAAGPELLRLFTGTLQSVEVTSQGKVTLGALDARAVMRDMYLPTMTNVAPNGLVQHGLDGHFLMGYLLARLGYDTAPPWREGARLHAPMNGSLLPAFSGVFPQNDPEHVAGPFGEAMRPKAAAGFLGDPIQLTAPYAVDMEGWFNTGGATSIYLMAVGYHEATTVENDRIDVRVYSDGRLTGWVRRWDSATATRTSQGYYIGPVVGPGWHYIAARFIPHADGTYRWWGNVDGQVAFADGNLASEGGAAASASYIYIGNDPTLGADKTPAMSAAMVHQVSGVTDAEPTWWNHDFTPTSRLDPTVLTLDNAVEAGRVDAWRIAQDIAAAEYGVFGISEAGDPFFRNMHWPYENTAAVKTVTADDASKITAELNTNNVYGAVTAEATNYREEGTVDDKFIWEAQQAYRLDGTLEINADAGRPIRTIDQSETRLTTTNDADANTHGTAYRANTEEDGTGTDVAVDLTFEPHATGTVVRSTDNPGGSTGVGYLVGTSGDPALWIVGRGIERSGSDRETVGDGEPRLDLAGNAWRQDTYNLRPVLARLLDDLSQPRAVITGLDVWPDPRLQLTDRARVIDTEGLALDDDFHVTDTALTFDATDGLSQTVGLRAAAALFRPSDVAGLVAHFDAADPNGDGGATLPADGAAISSWTNLVDGSTVTQPTAANQPTWHADRTLTGRPAVRFDAGAVYLSGAVTIPNDKTVIAVGQCIGLGAGGGDYVIGRAAGATKWALNQANTADTAPTVGLWSGVGAYTDYLLQGAGFVAVTSREEGAVGQVRANGRFGVLQGGQNTESSAELYIGPEGTVHWGNMEITALLIWNRVLTDDEAQKVEQWIGHTYGIAVGK